MPQTFIYSVTFRVFNATFKPAFIKGSACSHSLEQHCFTPLIFAFVQISYDQKSSASRTLRETFQNKSQNLPWGWWTSVDSDPGTSNSCRFHTCSRRLLSRSEEVGAVVHHGPVQTQVVQHFLWDEPDSQLKERHVCFIAPPGRVDLLRVKNNCMTGRGDWPGEGVVEDECVFSGVPDFQFPLDRLFVGVTASQWDQNLHRGIGLDIYSL